MAKPKMTLGTQWMSTPDVLATLAKAKTNRQAQQRLLASYEAKISLRRDDVARSLNDLPSAQRTNLTNRAVAGYRADLRSETDATRLAYVKEAGRHREAMRSVASHYRSSVQMLARYTLGSERRSRIMQQISASGPAEIASLAELAAATKDLELGAALCSRVFELDAVKRPFAAAELADALLGAEFREVSQAILEVDRLALEAVTDDTGFETGKGTDPHRALEIALMQQAEGLFASEGADEEEGN
jgi:hypothetical protein